MADEKPDKEATEEEQPKKKAPILTLAIVAVVMVLEGIGAIGFIMFSGSGAADASANSIEGEELAEQEKTVEIALVDGRFQNHTGGNAWSWNFEAVLQVKKKNEEEINLEIERRKAEITEGVALIIRRSAHAHLMEPGLETLHRQVAAYIEQVFGFDPDGEHLVERVLIPRCQGYPPS